MKTDTEILACYSDTKASWPTMEGEMATFRCNNRTKVNKYGSENK